jgi:hypothetical protein
MERETELEERQRHDREIAEENRARQERLGDISADSQPEPDVSDKPQNQENEGAASQQYTGGEIPRQEPQTKKPE